MPFETLLALAGILAAATWTPGPNNSMLAASGATFGMRRTLPHAWGVTLGFPVMLMAVALGLGEVFQRSELVREALRYSGAALLIWVAWRIARAGRSSETKAAARPFTFLQAAGFQWINPKAWVMCLAITSQFVTGERFLVEAGTCALVSALTGFTSSHGWAGFGAILQRWLARGRRLQIFNLSMAAIILLGVVYLLSGDLG